VDEALKEVLGWQKDNTFRSAHNQRHGEFINGHDFPLARGAFWGVSQWREASIS
jgi:hypothetical protein